VLKRRNDSARKAYFDDDLIERGYMTTVIIRAPLPRFSSALLQHIRSFGGGDKHFVTAQTITAYVAKSQIRDLCEPAATDVRCIHFRRQSDFLAAVPAEARDLVLMQDLSTRFPALPIENRGAPAKMGQAGQTSEPQLVCTRYGPHNQDCLVTAAGPDRPGCRRGSR